MKGLRRIILTSLSVVLIFTSVTFAGALTNGRIGETRAYAAVNIKKYATVPALKKLTKARKMSAKEYTKSVSNYLGCKPYKKAYRASGIKFATYKNGKVSSITITSKKYSLYGFRVGMSETKVSKTAMKLFNSSTEWTVDAPDYGGNIWYVYNTSDSVMLILNKGKVKKIIYCK